MSNVNLPILPKDLVERHFGQGDPATKRWYDANCHCGAVRFRFRMTDLKSTPITHCNCSICTKNGLLNVYPRRDEVEWLRGYDTMSSYRTSTKMMDHKFCPNCGSSILIDFNWTDETQPYAGDRLAINVSAREFLKTMPNEGRATDVEFAMQVRMVKDFEDKGLNLRESTGKEDIGVPYQLEG